MLVLLLGGTAVVAFAPLVLWAGDPGAPAVRLEIDYKNGVQRIYTLPWKTGMTVFDALKAAEASKPGIALRYNQSGGKETIFVTEIDAFVNEGSGADKKNWLFWVNDKFADKGCGVYELKASDAAVWRFDVWKDEARKGE